MGVDLKLLVCDGPKGNWFAHTIIGIGRWYDLYTTLDKKARTLPGWVLNSYFSTIPDGKWQGENGYGPVTETPYGNKITYVTAAEFLEAVQEIDGRPPSWWNAKAAIAYIKHMPADMFLALYYH